MLRPTPNSRMRKATPFILLACACGAAMHGSPPGGAAAPQPAARAGSGGGDAGPAAGFDAILARGASVAPGMRERARKESAGDRVELVRAEGRDVCVRVAFEATAPVLAKLVDAAGGALAATHAAEVDGVLGERGPVCVRKGDSVSGIADGPAARVRWVAWSAP